MAKYLKIILIMFAVITIAFVPHFVNMFHYPYYENDEGTYMSQAWSLLTEHKLAPYTYWYDHAPAGWVLIAIWVKLTGGFYTFGATVNSGRVLMLFIHILSSLLLFYIAKKTSKSNIAGLIAVILFSVSPLGLYFQRRVLLDNMMIFWVLLSLALLYYRENNMKNLVLSAITFGIAVLTKENAIFFMPVFLYFIYSKANKHQKEFLLSKWLVISVSVISVYFLYAFLKKELFPVGFMGDNSPRVSLITTLQNQYSRGVSMHFWDHNSYFYKNFIGWGKGDPFLMTFGVIAILINSVIAIFKKSFRIPAFMGLMFLAFLARGKLVLDFYVIPLIPILALNAGVLMSAAIKRATMNIPVFKYALLIVLVMFAIRVQYFGDLQVYAKDETSNQLRAIDWIRKNVDTNDKIVIDDSIYVDLHEPRFSGDKIFPNADWSWKVEEDPAVLNEKLGGSFLNIKYLVISHEILKQIHDSEFHFIKKALDNSSKVVMWQDGSSSYVNVSEYISTNGDWMGVYKIDDKNSLLLQKSWDFYKKNFIKSYGQVVDPDNNNTTSEGQAYGMLRSVFIGDKTTFDNLWKWTQDHLQFRVQDKLISWLWLNDGKNGKLGDSEAASDADQDMALALLMASKKWNDESYLNSAQILIDNIWDHEVVKIAGKYYVISGPGGKREDGYLVNPSYFSPASYKLFAEVDKKHPWTELSQNSYLLLNELAKNSASKLPPNWILVDDKTGEIKTPEKYISDTSANWYGFDAFRVMWRVSLDNLWFNSKESRDYLNLVSPFFEGELKNKLYAIYSLDGSPRVNYDSLSTTTGAFFALNKTNSTLATDVFKNQIESKFNMDTGSFGDGKNYFDQNWAWFASAFYYGKITNLFAQVPKP